MSTIVVASSFRRANEGGHAMRTLVVIVVTTIGHVGADLPLGSQI
jgi:hypothetical protein